MKAKDNQEIFDYIQYRLEIIHKKNLEIEKKYFESNHLIEDIIKINNDIIIYLCSIKENHLIKFFKKFNTLIEHFQNTKGYDSQVFYNLYQYLNNLEVNIPNEIIAPHLINNMRYKFIEKAKSIQKNLFSHSIKDLNEFPKEIYNHHIPFLILKNGDMHFLINYSKIIFKKKLLLKLKKSVVKIRISSSFQPQVNSKFILDSKVFYFKHLPGDNNFNKELNMKVKKIALWVQTDAVKSMYILTDKVLGTISFNKELLKKQIKSFKYNQNKHQSYVTLKNKKYFIFDNF